MTGVKWSVYRVQVVNDDGSPVTGPCTLETPSPGVAVEACLALHGVLRYDRIWLWRVDGVQPDEDKEAILQLFPNAEQDAQGLDEFHTWEEVPPPPEERL